jgi:nucleoside-diphosphate-sugar epimerase
MYPAPIDPNFPRAPEHSIVVLADRGVRATVVRLPRSVHGRGETHGFVPMVTAVARKKGVSAYVGDGDNLWPSVHRLDAAHLFCLALEHGAQGGPFHAVADEGVPYRQIAKAIARQLGIPARSLTTEEATAHFGPLAMWVSGNGPASSLRTRERLGWEPKQASLIADIDHPDYFKP